MSSFKPRHTHISTFYPHSKSGNLKYIEGTDYDRTVLDSPFTLAKCKEIVSFIDENVGSENVYVLNYRPIFLPLIIELLQDPATLYLFIYAAEDEYKQMLINVLVLLKLTEKCELRETEAEMVDSKDLIYLGLDAMPMKPVPKEGVATNSLIRAKILIRSEDAASYVIATTRKGHPLAEMNLANIDVSIDVFKGEEETIFAEEKKRASFFKRKTVPLSETEATRQITAPKKPEPVTSKIKSVKKKTNTDEEEDEVRITPKIKSVKKKTSTSDEEEDEATTPKSKKKTNTSSKEEERGSAKPIRSILKSKVAPLSDDDEEPEPEVRRKEKPASNKQVKEVKKTIVNRTGSDEEDSAEEKTPVVKKKTERHVAFSDEVKTAAIGKIKKHTLGRPNHNNIQAKTLPTKGGWIEFLDNELVFYILGAKHLPRMPRKLDKAGPTYLAKFKDYLQQLLTLFLDDKKAAIGMTAEPLMPLWVQAWTHETYDINTNYEALEMIGDAGLSFGFTSFIYKTQPDITSSELTSLKIKTLDKISLRQISWELGMDSWVRINEDAITNTNVAEDLVESFCQVLQVAGTYYLAKEKEVSQVPGPGIFYLHKFVDFLFGTVNFPPVMYAVDSKTGLLQAAEGLGAGRKSIEETITVEASPGGGTVFVLSLDWVEKAMSYFRKNEIKMAKHIITTTAFSKKAAISSGYRAAVAELYRRGLSIQKLLDIKHEATMATFDPRLVANVMKKVHAEYGKTASIRFSTPKGLATNATTTIQLIAVIPNQTRRGKRVLLSTATGPTELGDEIKAEVLNVYLRD